MPARNTPTPKERNGYAALAKWDGRKHRRHLRSAKAKDGFITAADDVFPKLRLWADANRDGDRAAE